MYQPKYRRQDKLNPVTTHVGSNWRRIQTGVAFLLWSWSGRQRPACVRVHHSYRPRLVPAVLLLFLNRGDISDECRHKKEMEVSNPLLASLSLPAASGAIPELKAPNDSLLRPEGR